MAEPQPRTGPGDPPGKLARPPARRLYATVLVMEAIVIGLAIPVAVTIEHVHAGMAGPIGAVAAAAAIILAAAAGRGSRPAVAGGTVLQVLLIVAGVAVPAMLILGLVFAALWATAIWLGRRLAAP
jgi:hypothetical protein